MRRFQYHGVLIALAALALAAVSIPWLGTPSLAHGFGPRYDLPIPLTFYIAGAGAIVALSFAAFALFFDAGGARRDDLRLIFRPSARLVRLGSPVLLALRVLVAALFFVFVATGFLGSQNPFQNILPTLIWILGWVGIAFACIFVTDVWRFLNPWSSPFEVAERLYVRLSGKAGFRPLLSCPRRLGVWPAFAFFIVFAWLELVWIDRAVPAELASVVLVYSAITWAGMIMFGRDRWLECGEFLTIVFGVFARFGPLAGERGERPSLVLRLPAAGLLEHRQASASMTALIVALLATVTFDGLLETSLWGRIDVLILSSPLDSPIWTVLKLKEVVALQIARSIGLVLAIVVMSGAYFLICWLMSVLTAEARIGPARLARNYVFSLVPISIAYHVAHYFSFLFIGGQYAVPVLSDPLALGWDIFGTASYRVDIGLIGPRLQWLVAVVAVVVGHVVSVYLAHVTALRIYRDKRLALLSQIPMLTFMVGYTMLSLWILSQPII